jgi:DNA-binding transcriptional regulator YdaS (Cro superfamily)
MTLKQLIERAANNAGTAAALARELGVSTSKVYDWRDGRQPCTPADQARIAAWAGDDPVQQLVRATIEQAKGDTRREQLKKLLGKSLHRTGAGLGFAALAMTIPYDRLIRCIERLNALRFVANYRKGSRSVQSQ